MFILTKMPKVTIFFWVIIMVFIGTSCASKQGLATIKPEPETAAPLVYDNTPSFINVPVSIKLKDVENQINIVLKGLIYEDKIIEDDDIEIKIWKQGPITIQSDNASKGEKIKTMLP